MKITLLAALVGSAAAFVPSSISPRSAICISSSTSSLAAAKSKEEDIELTLKVIMDNLADSSDGIDDSDDNVEDTPAPAAAAAPASPGPAFKGAWSVDYDATVVQAYAAAGSKGDYGAFKEKFLVDTSAVVGKKGLM